MSIGSFTSYARENTRGGEAKKRGWEPFSILAFSSGDLTFFEDSSRTFLTLEPGGCGGSWSNKILNPDIVGVHISTISHAWYNPTFMNNGNVGARLQVKRDICTDTGDPFVINGVPFSNVTGVNHTHTFSVGASFSMGGVNQDRLNMEWTRTGSGWNSTSGQQYWRITISGYLQTE